VEQRDSMASLTSREENVLEVGRAEATTEEKRVGDRLRRLQWKETIGVEADGLLGKSAEVCDRQGLCGTVSCENEI